MFLIRIFALFLIFIWAASFESDNEQCSSDDNVDACSGTSIKMTDRLELRQILSNIVDLSKEMNADSIAKIGQLIEKINIDVLNFKLPASNSLLDLYFSSVYETDKITCSIFTFKRKGVQIPLHDHRNCFGFIRVLSGSFKVRSFSLLEKQKMKELINELKTNSNDFDHNMIPVIYEGEQIVTTNDSVIMLDPQKSNIHEIVALQDDSAFFDILIPGYKSRCIYYSQVQSKLNALKNGDVSWLKAVGQPINFYTASLHYDTLELR